MKYGKETFIIDLNDVTADGLLYVSRRETLEYGSGVLVTPLYGVEIRPHDYVEVFSDEEKTTWDAEIVEVLPHGRYTVRVFWDSGLTVSQTGDFHGSARYVNAGTSFTSSVVPT